MNLKSMIYIACCMAVMSCGPQKKKAMEETEVLIETSMGDMKVKLYNDTPKHRDNFIKLARAGAYDNILFHRVVRGFMVQTGDPALKPGGMKPAVDTAAYRYTIPAEIRYPRHFHKKGALAAARMGDDVNPEKGLQRYAVLYRDGEDLYAKFVDGALFGHLPKPGGYALRGTFARPSQGNVPDASSWRNRKVGKPERLFVA